ncbi:hypothetical protein ACHAW6_007538 [Cyclotella cf. meneghiniana]
MTSSCFWDDNIDWGDSSSSTIHKVEPVRKPSRKLLASSKNKVAESSRSPSKSRPMIYDAHVGRAALGKRRSWLDWFENDDEYLSKSGSPTLNFSKQGIPGKENAKHRRKSSEDGAADRCEKRTNGSDSTLEQKSRSSTFFPLPFQMLVPLEHEGVSTVDSKRLPGRRSTVTMSNETRPQFKKALGGNLKQSTCELVKKASTISEESVDDELHVPFPSRPRRRSVY